MKSLQGYALTLQQCKRLSATSMLLFLCSAVTYATTKFTFTWKAETNTGNYGFFQQPQQPITGVVTDGKSNPLPGVNVMLKGGRKGAQTDANGRFTLNEPAGKGILVFSYTGFATQEIPLSGKGITIDVSLSEQMSNLNEVVVVGYGTQTKKDLTGAVSQVKVAQLENENPQSVQDALRGNVPGLSISQTNSASAKGGGDLQVRGRSSINAGTTPLFVVDGVIYPGQLSDINPNDIATIDVLKDASSTAVFGAKAASGVVLITTKKGSKVKPTITVNSNIGFGELAMNEPLYDGPGFINWRTDVMKSVIINSKPYQFNDPRSLPSDITVDQWKAYDNSLGDPVDIWLTRLKMLPIERQNYGTAKTINWYDMMFQKGLRQDHTVSISGKKEDISYYLSMGYTDNEGVIVGDDFQTFRTRLNLEARAAKFISVGMNMQFSDRDESQVPVAWVQMVNASPYGELYKPDGITLRDSPNDDIGNNTNPFLDNVYTQRLQRYNSLFGSLYAKGDLGHGFSYQVNFTPNFSFYRYFNGQSAKDFRVSARKGVATRTDSTSYNWQIDNLLKWNGSFGEHKIDVTLLANAEKFQSWRNQMDNEGFDPNDNLSYHNIGAGIKPVISSDDQYSTGDALMARLNYSFRERYMLTASFRRDGYSAFGQKNPRADFPSVALGWIFSEEKFMESASWISYAKIRASYGINGNRDIGRYSAISDLTTGKYQYITASGAMVLVSQLYVNRLQNPNLKWEKTTSYNLGLDFSFMKNRLGGSVDLYKKETRDLLILRALPDVTGFINVWDNLGQVDNKGIEVSLNSTNINARNFIWRSTLNFSLNRNKIVHLYGAVNVLDSAGKVIGSVERDDVANRWFIGHDINEIWDLKVLGVWQQNELAEAAKYGVRPGDFKIEDVNRDGKFSDADRQFIGHANPRFQWTLRNEFTFYKNFDFSFMLYSSWGMKASDNNSKNNSGFIDRQNSYRFPYWTVENPTNDYARLFSSNGSASFSVYRNSSFIRLNTVALGYKISPELAQRLHLESFKVYANVTNLGLYAPDWNFWDPEFRNRDNANVITTAIPPRIYSLGINVTF